MRVILNRKYTFIFDFRSEECIVIFDFRKKILTMKVKFILNLIQYKTYLIF